VRSGNANLNSNPMKTNSRHLVVIVEIGLALMVPLTKAFADADGLEALLRSPSPGEN
jgi:hypothetical protein